MQIVCPSCASRYEIDAAKLGPAGRKVRCASCQTLWHVDPADAFPEAPSAEDTQAALNEELQRAAEIEQQISAVAAEQDDEPKPLEEAKDPPPRKRSTASRLRKGASKAGGVSLNGMRLLAGLALAGLVLIGGMVWQRNVLTRAVPQLAGVFDGLGLPVNVRGLSLTSVESGLVQEGQGRFLVVEGDVTNITKSVTTLPPIEVAVRDATGQTLYTWTTDPPRPKLEPAELVRFRARLAAPPDAGKSVRVRFGEAKAPAVAKTQ